MITAGSILNKPILEIPPLEDTTLEDIDNDGTIQASPIYYDWWFNNDKEQRVC
jgi:hypothetical protein